MDIVKATDWLLVVLIDVFVILIKFYFYTFDINVNGGENEMKNILYVSMGAK